MTDNFYSLTVKDAAFITTHSGGELKYNEGLPTTLDIHFFFLNEHEWCLDLAFEGHDNFVLNSINGDHVEGAKNVEIYCDEEESWGNRGYCKVIGAISYLPTSKGDFVVQLIRK